MARPLKWINDMYQQRSAGPYLWTSSNARHCIDVRRLCRTKILLLLVDSLRAVGRLFPDLASDSSTTPWIDDFYSNSLAQSRMARQGSLVDYEGRTADRQIVPSRRNNGLMKSVGVDGDTCRPLNMYSILDRSKQRRMLH